jgi:hypothetical protein
MEMTSCRHSDANTINVVVQIPEDPPADVDVDSSLSFFSLQ